MAIKRIVLTGGPCAGKTTGMSWIQNEFTKRGYKVIFVPEAATELILAGVSRDTLQSQYEFQKCLLDVQIDKEEVYEYAASIMKDENVLIVYDRGVMDGKAFTTEEEFRKLLQERDLNEVEVRDRYEAVFHLETAAKGAVEFYTTANNHARTETPEQASDADDKLIAAWNGHPHHHVIGNSTGFEEKMKVLLREISAEIGEASPYEYLRKFLIEYPDVEKLSKMPNCKKVEINQIYLLSKDGEETRIRQRGENGKYIYSMTRKIGDSLEKRVEIEERLTQEEFLTKMMQADPNRRPLRKDRYCLRIGDLYYEIDLYPFWKDQAIMDVEVMDPNQELMIPDEIKVIREVTGEIEYRNSHLAMI